MVANRWEDLKIGDTVYPYNVESGYMLERIVTGIKISGLDSLGKIEGIEVSFGFVQKSIDAFSSGRPFIVEKDGDSFYIKYSDEKSRRGNKYIGFLTEKAAIEYELEILQNEVYSRAKKVIELEELLKTK